MTSFLFSSTRNEFYPIQLSNPSNYQTMTEQRLYKVPVTSKVFEEEPAGFFDMICACGKLDETDEFDKGFVTTEEVAKTLKEMKNVTTEEDMLKCLKKITKFASSFAFNNEARTEFLKDIVKLKGVSIILKAMNYCMEDPAIILCSAKALKALLVTQEDIVDFWSSTRQALIDQFFKESGMEIITKAFGLKAIKYDPYEVDDGMDLYRTDLRYNIMEICYVTTPHATADCAVKLLQFWCRVVPKMIPPNDKVNENAIEQVFWCIMKTLEVKGIQRLLTRDDVLQVVAVSVAAEKACSPQNKKVASAIRAVWSWAGSCSAV
jgi:hypothetical protein